MFNNNPLITIAADAVKATTQLAKAITRLADETHQNTEAVHRQAAAQEQTNMYVGAGA